jgi:hypothetical protein
MPRKTLISPDRRITGQLVEAGKIRFGPPYYELQIAPYDFSGRWFLGPYVWSPQSRFLAITESLAESYSDGPHTELLLLDLLDEMECPLSKAPGYIVPLRIEHPLVIYEKQFRGRRSGQEFEIEYPTLDRWRPLTKETKAEQ